ncbi:LPS export ABC transporter permease LptG [Chlorobium sp. N1]|uniref:LPS export ABC transporter permease LptG n=1 Tax=Chlorobium sp. N1 TaxID=2491138 RepID=UPI00103D9752|nr:LPS export ABC transporter permease LptG [Chlorobium sp. N1]TCD47563.1 LPS export ABC transporter permease LptG [Chlorobium sp. N1]
MKILDRYILLQFLRTFLFTSLTFLSLFTLINMVENLDGFMDKGQGWGAILQYYLFAVPQILLITSPVSSLLASILVAGRLAVSSELPAIRSAGIGMGQLLYPFMIGGALISGLNLMNSFWLAPATTFRNNDFERRYLNKQQKNDLDRSRNLHILEPGERIVTLGLLNPDMRSADDVSIEQFGPEGVVSRLDADSLGYNRESGEWVLSNVSERTFEGGRERFSSLSHLPVPLTLTLKSLAELNLRPDEMNINSHWEYLSEKKQAGFAGLERSSVKLHTKFSLPFASLIIILIGVPLSAKKKRGGLATEIGISLFAGFLFLGLQKTIATFGYNGVMPPILSAWLPNLLFLGVGYALYRYSPD